MAAFATDDDVAPALARLLAADGHDVATARDRGLLGATDDEHLIQAALAGRILITHNEDDFVLLHRAWRRWPAVWGIDPTPQHAGILILPQVQGPRHYSPAQRYGPSVQAIAAMVAVWQSLAGQAYIWRGSHWDQVR